MLEKPSKPQSRLTPMDMAQAKSLAGFLLSAFSHQKPREPEVFIALLIENLVKYPFWVGERVVKHIIATHEFLTIASIVKRCEEDIAAFRYAAQWDRDAAQSGAAQLEGPPRPARPTYEELKAKYGPNWGIMDYRRANRPPTREEALARGSVGRECASACANRRGGAGESPSTISRDSFLSGR